MYNKKKEYDYDYGTLGYCKLVSQDGLKKFISECGASFNIIGRAKEKQKLDSYDYGYGTLGSCKLASQDGLKKFISECGDCFMVVGREQENENPNSI